MVGGIIVGVTQALCEVYISIPFAKVAVFIVMLLVLVVKPSGLFGTRSSPCLRPRPARRRTSRRPRGGTPCAAATRARCGSRRGSRSRRCSSTPALPLYIGPGLQSAGQYVMIGGVGAIGLTLVIGQAGQLSLAHAFFLLVGATAYAVLAGETEQAGAEYVVGLGLPPLLALIGAVLISGLARLAVAPIAGRLKGIYLGVASLALVFLGFYLGQALPQLTGGAASGRSPEPFSLFGFPFTNEVTSPCSASRSASPSGSGICSSPSPRSPTCSPAARHAAGSAGPGARCVTTRPRRRSWASTSCGPRPARSRSARRTPGWPG